MGTAPLHLDNCLLLNNKECIRCRESCKFDAIRFILEDNILSAIPVVDHEKCAGCGACEVICPESCIIINPLNKAEEMDKFILLFPVLRDSGHYLRLTMAKCMFY